MENNKQIKIDSNILFEYYKAATVEQKSFLNTHFKLDGSTTVNSIKGLYNIACDNWKSKIKANHPDCFIEQNVWKRDNKNIDRKEFYFLKDRLEGHYIGYSAESYNTNLNYTFETLEEADNNALLYNTMILMRNWAKFHNKLDNFVVDWRCGGCTKWGIAVEKNCFHIDNRWTYNYFLFQIPLSSRKRAEEMLIEFKTDLEILIELGMFN